MRLLLFALVLSLLLATDACNANHRAGNADIVAKVRPNGINGGGPTACPKSLVGGLTCNGVASGLLGLTAVFLRSSSVTASYECVDQHGKLAPGQPVVTQNVTGQIEDITPLNLQIAYSVTIPPPPPPSAVTECLDGSWTVSLTSLTFNNVELHIQMPPGTDLQVFNLGTIDP